MGRQPERAGERGTGRMAALDAEAIEHALLDALSAGEDAEVRT